MSPDELLAPLSPEQREAIDASFLADLLAELAQWPDPKAALRAVVASLEKQSAEPFVQYKYEPVSIMQFVEDPFYLGLPKEERWPKCMDVLAEIAEGTYHEVVLCGSIGWGKSHVSRLLFAYDLYCISCLALPQRTFGLARDSSIVFINQSITEEKARKVLFDELKRVIQRSPYFRQLFPWDHSLKTMLVFPHGVRCEPVAGHELAAIGENVVEATLDETNFMAVVEKSRRAVGKDVRDVAEQNYAAIVRRMKSRYMRQGKLPGHLILVSSARYPEDFTERKKREAKTDPTIYVADYATWETPPPGRYLGPTFRVYVGSGLERSRILEDAEPVPAHADEDQVITPPVEYRKDFERDIDDAIRDIAGRSTLALRPFIARREMLGRVVRPWRKNPFSHVVSSLRDGITLLTQHLDLEVLAPRAAHIDFGLGHPDPAGLCFGYVKGMQRIERSAVGVQPSGDLIQELGPDGLKVYVEELPVIVIEGMLRVQPAPNDEVQFEDIIELLVRIAELVPLRWVTADSWQSLHARQVLARRGFTTGLVSLDTDVTPYADFKSALYDSRLDMPDYWPFIEEASALEKNERTGKVDHPKWAIGRDGKRVPGRKDVADAVAGVCHTLTRRRESWVSTQSRTTTRPTITRPVVVRP